MANTYCLLSGVSDTAAAIFCDWLNMDVIFPNVA